MDTRILRLAFVAAVLSLADPPPAAPATSGLREYVLNALARNASPDDLDERGYALLHHVAAAGDVETLQFLLRRGATIDVLSRNEGLTPLGYGALYDKTAAVEALLGNGADPNGRQGLTGWPPVYCAAKAGSLSSARRLVKAGARPDELLYDEGKPTFLLVLALAQRDLRAAEILLEVGAAPDITKNLGDASLPLLTRAVDIGCPHLLQLMLDKGADAAVADYAGVTPLHQAAGTGRADLALLLLQHGAPRTARLGAAHPEYDVTAQGTMVLVTPKGAPAGTMPAILPALPAGVAGLTPSALARRNDHGSTADRIDRWRSDGPSPFITKADDLARRVDTLLGSSRQLGRTYSGWADEAGRVGTWPFTIQAGPVKGRSGSFDGWISWTTLQSKHRIEGSIRGNRLVFTETSVLTKGDAAIGTKYTFDLQPTVNPFPTHLRGVWTLGKDQGAVRLILEATSRSATWGTK